MQLERRARAEAAGFADGASASLRCMFRDPAAVPLRAREGSSSVTQLASPARRRLGRSEDSRIRPDFAKTFAVRPQISGGAPRTPKGRIRPRDRTMGRIERTQRALVTHLHTVGYRRRQESRTRRVPGRTQARLTVIIKLPGPGRMYVRSEIRYSYVGCPAQCLKHDCAVRRPPRPWKTRTCLPTRCE